MAPSRTIKSLSTCTRNPDFATVPNFLFTDAMRTYDKLIATIQCPKAWAGLRSYLGLWFAASSTKGRHLQAMT